jgi:hypothetical protein
MNLSHRLLFISSLAWMTSASASTAAPIILDEVMTKEEQQKTGINRLSFAQKVQLESWLNKNFVLKTPATSETHSLSLSINIENGRKIQLSDNSIWEIAPSDIQTASVWVIPFPVTIEPSNDPDYPYTITNVNSGVSVRARKALQQNPSTPSE